MSTKTREITKYTDKEKEYIFNTAYNAKNKGLELKTVFIGLADQYNTTSGAISQLYYKMFKERKSSKQIAFTDEDVVHPTIPENKDNDLISALEKLIEERNFYKNKYEQAMKLLDLL